ncbi:unnamed protein product [Ilex paraguariensis]|uniref:PHD-type domain-containing protein n=1 Tax=Ilex paraguariensis TaxID=185542 RepID=A0ABC8U390_9AQUA
MTGGRCQQRRNMTVAMGCGVQEKPCPISRAKKALSKRSPFDSEDVQVSTVLSLPSGLASWLSKYSDGRKLQKKSHSGSEKKGSTPNGSEKVRGSNIWVETEEYFRELTVDDIEKLCEVSKIGFSGTEKCFRIPSRGNESSVRDYTCNGHIADNPSGVSGHGVELDSRVGVKGEAEEESEQFMEVDTVGANELVQQDKGSSLPQSSVPCSGFEWLLGSRSKIYLASERPNKRRKLLGGHAGLDKLLVACPVTGSSSLCHYCSLGDMGDQLNRIIVCNSCGVAVHWRCYGVHDDVDGSWLCCWCKRRKEVLASDRPCLLCLTRVVL